MSKQIRMALIAAAATAATFGASSAMAADGTINFTGSIIAASCSLVGGSGTNVSGGKGDQIIDVKLGKVTTDSLGGTAGGNIIAGTAINLDLNCDNSAQGLKTVKVRFDPASGSRDRHAQQQAARHHRPDRRQGHRRGHRPVQRQERAAGPERQRRDRGRSGKGRRRQITRQSCRCARAT